MHDITQVTTFAPPPRFLMNTGTLTVAIVAVMPYPMAKASYIWVSHLVNNLASQFDDVPVQVFA